MKTDKKRTTDEARIKYDFSTTQWQGADLDKLKEHLIDHIDLISQYPERTADTLSRLLSRRLEIKEDEIIVTDGSTGAYHLMARAMGEGTKSLILPPTNPEYRKALRKAGHEIIVADEFKDLTKLPLEGVNMVWISNPNSPDGRFFSRRSLLTLLREHPDILFMIDLSMDNFVVDDNLKSADIHRYKNLVITSSYSKAFNIPGLRIGYLVSTSERVTRCKQINTPGSISSLAIEAVRYILLHPATFTIPVRKWLRDANELATNLDNIEGIATQPSSTPFFIIDLEDYNATDLANYLLDKHQIRVATAKDDVELSENQIRVCTLPGVASAEALAHGIQAFVQEFSSTEDENKEEVED